MTSSTLWNSAVTSVNKFLPPDARTASVVFLSQVVRPSVCLSVCLYVTLWYRGHIGWTS